MRPRVTLVAVTCLAVVGVVVFAHGPCVRWVLLTRASHWAGWVGGWAGFLLRRTVAGDDVGTVPPGAPLQRYERLVLVVIDALRHDFVAPQSATRPYTNRLKAIQAALADPTSARLYRFEARIPCSSPHAAAASDRLQTSHVGRCSHNDAAAPAGADDGHPADLY
jgi:hypothetical protein